MGLDMGMGHGGHGAWTWVCRGPGLRPAAGMEAGPAQMNNVGPRRACAARVSVCYILPGLAACLLLLGLRVCLSVTLVTLSRCCRLFEATTSPRSPDVHAPALTSILAVPFMLRRQGTYKYPAALFLSAVPPLSCSAVSPRPVWSPPTNPPHCRPERDIIELNAPSSVLGEIENRIRMG